MKPTTTIKSAIPMAIHTVVVLAIYLTLLWQHTGNGNLLLVIFFLDFPYSLYLQSATSNGNVTILLFLLVGGLHWLLIGYISQILFKRRWYWAVLGVAVFACLCMACLFGALSKPM
jgi:hypothetical protein